MEVNTKLELLGLNTLTGEHNIKSIINQQFKINKNE